MRALVCLAALLIPAAAVAAQPRNTLDIYVVDVEGGNGTLFVTPSGESVLIDTGNAGDIASKRDAGRIMDAIHDAGLTQIDHLILTHYHGDHFGGMAELAKQIPIREFIDHGPNMQPGAGADFYEKVYPQLYAKGKHTVAKAGDRIALKGGVEWRIVASNGEVTNPLPGAGERNPECASFQPIDNNIEDPLSVASYITFGRFRTAHLGDLTRNMEFKLMCPYTRLPMVDLLLGMHHGQDSSNSPVMDHALRPRVGIMNNGTRKGGEPFTMLSIHSSPGFEDLWQMHFSLLSGQEYTQPGMFIANLTDDRAAVMPIEPMKAPAPGTPGIQPAPVHNGKAYWIKVSAQYDGTFTVTNQRNGFSKTYTPR